MTEMPKYAKLPNGHTVNRCWSCRPSTVEPAQSSGVACLGLSPAAPLSRRAQAEARDALRPSAGERRGCGQVQRSTLCVCLARTEQRGNVCCFDRDLLWRRHLFGSAQAASSALCMKTSVQVWRDAGAPEASTRRMRFTTYYQILVGQHTQSGIRCPGPPGDPFR